MSYLIKTYFEVFEDDYNEGEGKHVNSWSHQSEHDAIESALQQHFGQLGLSYDVNHIHEDDGDRYYSWTVDEDCCEATEKEIEQWKRGEIKLYSQHANIKIYKLEQI
jgi:hypothetical protein